MYGWWESADWQDWIKQTRELALTGSQGINDVDSSRPSLNTHDSLRMSRLEVQEEEDEESKLKDPRE